jgi:uncharacterized protein YbjT (DUF2867 family)
MKTAIVLGASGLVGGHCLKLLLEHPAYARVVSVGRRELPLSHPKLSQAVVDFDRLEKSADAFRGDDLFYCLGSTMKKAGSKEAFKKIDLDYAVAVARAAKKAGVRAFFLCSSVGADPRSPFFYLKIKGLAERETEAVGFERFRAFRPGLLLGDRGESRLAEKLAAPLLGALAPLMVGPLRKHRPVHGAEAARWMVDAAQLP